MLNWVVIDVGIVECTFWLRIGELIIRGKVNHAWERNLQSYLKHAFFDHRSKRGIFGNLLGFNEFWCVLSYKIMIKAPKISLVVKLYQFGAIS